MARETEIERLIVRLVGDDSSYQDMVDRAADGTGKLAGATEGAKEASENIQDPLEENEKVLDNVGNRGMGTARSFRYLGGQITQAGMAVTMFNAPLGMSIAGLGGMATTMSMATRGVQAMRGAMASLTASVAANSMAFAAGGVAIVGLAALTVAYKLVSSEAKKATEKSEGLFNLLRANTAEEAQRVSKKISQEDWLPEKADKYTQAAKDAEQVWMSAENEVSKLKKEVEGISWYDIGGRIDKPGLEKQLEQQRAVAADSHKNMMALKQDAEDAAEAQKKFMFEQAWSQFRGINESLSSMSSEYDRLTKTEKEAAKAAFIAKNDLMAKPFGGAVADWEKKWDENAASRLAKTIQGLSDSMSDMKGKEAEILDPLNSQLRIRNELAKANRDYFRSHNEAMPTILAAETEANIAMKDHLRLVQEGRAVYEQFMSPLDRMIQSQLKLKQQFEAGGFEKGEKGVKAYEKALAAAYGQAHKDYTAQFMGQQYDAIIGGTNAAARAMHEYTLGMTAIPLEQQAQKRRESDEEIFGYGEEVKPPLDSPAQLEMVQKLQNLADAVDRMVALTRAQVANRIQLLSANL